MKSVADILSENRTDLTRVRPEDSVFKAVRLLAERDLGAILVMDGERLVGIFSERDYTRKVSLMGRDPEMTLVRDIMTTEIVAIGPQQSAAECLEIMNQKGIRHVPVIAGEKVVGFISILDLANSILNRHMQKVAELEKAVSQMWPF